MDINPTYAGAFHRASRFTIQQANMVENQHINVQGVGTIDVLNELIDSVAIGALHNSGQRYDAPKCHPGTREAVLNEIMSWINDHESKFGVMWLRGPAGAGKSAIAQTVAEKCFDESKLCGSFFFSRHHAERNSSERLFATIAYQLAICAPQSREYISNALREQGPALLQLSLDHQIKHLVMNPFIKAVSLHPEIGKKCVIIDGLDECQESSTQANIVKCILYASMTPSNPIRFLLVSRPELALRQAFKGDDANCAVILDLDKKYDPERDIDWFLRDKIKFHHPVPLFPGSDWPTNEQIEHILQKSSGQFIYAATVIRYVENPRYNPIKSLQNLVGIGSYSRGMNPFAELDMLYLHILDAAVDFSPGIWPKLELIFGALLYLRSTKLPDLLDEFLGLNGDIMALLVDLHSILRIPEFPSHNEISFHHASFSDFLRDEERSGKYFIAEARAHLHLSECCVKCLKAYISDSSPEKSFPKTFYPAMRGYFHHVNRGLRLDPKIFCDKTKEITNWGVYYACRAAIESGYAKIGFRIQHMGEKVEGVLYKMDVRRYVIDFQTIGSSYLSKADLFSHGDIEWVFDEMQGQLHTFTIGTYIERGAGHWNHIFIDDEQGLKFIHNQLFDFVEIDPNINIRVRGRWSRQQTIATNFVAWIRSMTPQSSSLWSRSPSRSQSPSPSSSSSPSP